MMSTVTPQQPSNLNLPNALTVARILVVPVFVWFLVREGGQVPSNRWIACAIFMAAIATDRIDGQIARSRGLVTDFGKLADPIADKALIGSALIGLALINVIPWWITILVLAREVLITVMRIVMARRVVLPAGRGGKLKTATQAFALTLLCAPLLSLSGGSIVHAFAWVVLIISVVITVVTGLDYARQALPLWRAAAPSK